LPVKIEPIEDQVSRIDLGNPLHIAGAINDSFRTSVLKLR
jgi:hypothetical protein